MLKNIHQEELGRKGQRNSQKKQHSGEKGAPEKELGKHLKDKVKAIKGRICREKKSNNAMLKRTEKRKQQHQWNHMATDCGKWHLCKASSFSYGESPRTPPLEGTSLHRWNNSVERPWGILSLFTTHLQVQLHTKKTKITRRAGTWVEEVYEKDPKGSSQNERSPMKC